MADNDQNPPPFGPPGGFPEENEPMDMDVGKPAVASAPSRILMFVGIGGVFIALVLYLIVFSGGSKPPPAGSKTSIKPSQTVSTAPPPVMPPMPTPDATPPLPPPSSSGPPSLTPTPPSLVVPIVADGETNDETRIQRIRSPMVTIQNKGGGLLDGGDKAAPPSTDPNSAFADKVAASAAKKSKATRIGNINRVIAQGKVIHAVLETAINTQLPGTIRAITSRDTYSEGNKDILIPKGSRLIGVYNTDVFQGQGRVMIVWSRIIRPDGIDIKVDSPGVDQLGRAGLKGAVDTKTTEILTSAFMVGALGIGLAMASDAISGDDQTQTTTNTDGSSTTSGTATSQATTAAVARIGSVAERAVDKMIDTRPIITVDQGTRVNVLVNQDLIFPNLGFDSVNIP